MVLRNEIHYHASAKIKVNDNESRYTMLNTIQKHLNAIENKLYFRLMVVRLEFQSTSQGILRGLWMPVRKKMRMKKRVVTRRAVC